MRFPVLLAVPLMALTAAALPADDLLFVSPMGEPFLGDKASPPEKAWFDGADTDHDERLSLPEMLADAARFYKALDADGSGEIDPRELEQYETRMSLAIDARSRGRPMIGRGVEPDAFSGGPAGSRVYRAGGGVSRYNYLGIPQPVISADLNFNRGVSASEFQRAAQARFKLLDPNGDWVIERAELPRPPR